MHKLQNMKYLTPHTYQSTKQSLLWPHAVFSTLRRSGEGDKEYADRRNLTR